MRRAVAGDSGGAGHQRRRITEPARRIPNRRGRPVNSLDGVDDLADRMTLDDILNPMEGVLPLGGNCR